MGSSFGQDISRNSGCSSSELSCDSPGLISVVLTGTNELFELEPTIFEALKCFYFFRLAGMVKSVSASVSTIFKNYVLAISLLKLSQNPNKQPLLGSPKVNTVGVRTVCSPCLDFWKFFCSLLRVFGSNSPNSRTHDVRCSRDPWSN